MKYACRSLVMIGFAKRCFSFRGWFIFFAAIPLVGCAPQPVSAPGEKEEAVIAGKMRPARVLRWQGHWNGEGKREQLVREVLQPRPEKSPIR